MYGQYSREANFFESLAAATELPSLTFNVVVLVVVLFISDILLRLMVNYYLYAMYFFARGYVLVLGIFRFW